MPIVLVCYVVLLSTNRSKEAELQRCSCISSVVPVSAIGLKTEVEILPVVILVILVLHICMNITIVINVCLYLVEKPVAKCSTDRLWKFKENQSKAILCNGLMKYRYW